MDLRTPLEWCNIKGILIMDADGWRSDDAPRFDQPISEEEFDERIAICTVRHVD